MTQLKDWMDAILAASSFDEWLVVYLKATWLSQEILCRRRAASLGGSQIANQ